MGSRAWATHAATYFLGGKEAIRVPLPNNAKVKGNGNYCVAARRSHAIPPAALPRQQRRLLSGEGASNKSLALFTSAIGSENVEPVSPPQQLPPPPPPHPDQPFTNMPPRPRTANVSRTAGCLASSPHCPAHSVAPHSQ
ncbi:unnamed protein product [Pleuronectes platessa]|uniref:Uncharacterized protein n=1 Tax=Pleuronectes platessa TaxID=8262 RepID=A0A9N7YA87_PLEPL|nr:unnamed protein product [Pleuronectes platessa]